jgi:hypothetical protein
MADDLNREENYFYGIVAGLMALLQLVAILAILAAISGFSSGSLFLVSFIAVIAIGGLYAGANMAIGYFAQQRLEPNTLEKWYWRVRILGPIALFVLWWRYLRPRK